MSARRSHPGTVLLLVFASVLDGCGAGWTRVAIDDSLLARPRQQLRIWSPHGSFRWHGVHLTTDSVSGIPFYQPLTCDSCRRALPLAEVDSIQAGDPVGSFWKSVGLGGLLLVAGTYAGCAWSKDCNLGGD